MADTQTDTTVVGTHQKTVSFYATQEAGEQPVYHLLIADLIAGTVTAARLDREAAKQLAATIQNATGS